MAVQSLTDICRYRGDTYPEVFNIKEAGAVVDITGYSFLLTINPASDPSDTSEQLAQIAGVLTEPTAGRVSFPFSSVDLAPGNFFYDVQSVDTSANKKTHGVGSVVIIQDITKD